MTEIGQNEVINTIYNALADKKAENISVIDVREVSIMMDYLVIATGNNINQMQAMADNVEDELSKLSIHHTHIEGFKNANWILMDYGNYVVNIFDKEARGFYDLDHIWADGKKVDISDL